MRSQQLRDLYRESGVTGLRRLIGRTLFTALYHREVQYILLKRVESQKAVSPAPGKEGGAGTECLIVESAAALQEVVREMPATMRDSVDTLKERLERGCAVILARRPRRSEAGQEVVGYNICERGVFSALGRKRKIASDILFAHYTEVLPEYRGQRIAEVISGAVDEYGRAHGLTKLCSVISPANQASLRAFLRAGYTIVGTVARVSILRGLFIWETPWERIEAALRQVEPRGDRC